MIDIKEAIISKVIHHYIDHNNESLIYLNDDILNTESELSNDVLKKVFLKHFQTVTDTFEFKHSIDLGYNVLFDLSKRIYAEEDFITLSKEIMNHLKTSSSHPNIKSGDVFCVLLEDIKLGNVFYEGLGIYKFEDKEEYLETEISDGLPITKFRQGLGGKKPDKACLILFTEEPYTILVIDSKKETDYWQKNFINLGSKNDNVNSTNNFLKLTKRYLTSQIQEDFDVTKTDQIDLLNKSIEYFKTNDQFNKVDFEEQVLGDTELINSFNRFDENFRQNNQVEILDEFKISESAVKKQNRAYKSVLKLDKNFHIYIHGNRELIQQGVDEKGRKFYKIYYEEEN